MKNLTREQLDSIIELNRNMQESDPERYEAMQHLSLISAVANRIGEESIAQNAFALYGILSRI